VAWYAGVALADMGDISHLEDFLIAASGGLIEHFAKLGEQDDAGAISYGFLEFEVQQETIRALANFRGNRKVADFLLNILENPKMLLGRQDSKGAQRALRVWAICGLGAVGHSDDLDLVEKLTEKGTDEGKAAQAALQLFGRGTYDEIKKQAGINY